MSSRRPSEGYPWLTPGSHSTTWPRNSGWSLQPTQNSSLQRYVCHAHCPLLELNSKPMRTYHGFPCFRCSLMKMESVMTPSPYQSEKKFKARQNETSKGDFCFRLFGIGYEIFGVWNGCSFQIEHLEEQQKFQPILLSRFWVQFFLLTVWGITSAPSLVTRPALKTLSKLSNSNGPILLFSCIFLIFD